MLNFQIDLTQLTTDQLLALQTEIAAELDSRPEECDLDFVSDDDDSTELYGAVMRSLTSAQEENPLEAEENDLNAVWDEDLQEYVDPEIDYELEEALESGDVDPTEFYAACDRKWCGFSYTYQQLEAASKLGVTLPDHDADWETIKAVLIPINDFLNASRLSRA
jgi:hypothetical protein